MNYLFFFSRREEALNSTFSQSEFTLDQGERLLKGMQELREELNSHGGVVSRLVEEAQAVRPVKQRRAPVTRPLRAETVCAYKHANVSENLFEKVWLKNALSCFLSF